MAVGRMQTFSVDSRSRADPERVWRLLADTESWPRWTFPDEAALEREGSPEQEGVGAIRRFRTGRRITRERVVAFEPPQRFSYELLSGIPIRDYHADVALMPTADGGTLISWRSRFRGKFPVPAWLAKPKLRQVVRDTADALAREAEREA